MARKLLLLYALMAGAAVLLQVAFGGDPLALFVAGPLPAHAPELDIGAGVALGLAVVLLSRIGSAHLRWAQRIDAEFREMLAPLEGRHVPALAFMSSLAEELFFRGFLQPLLGLTATSILFGAAHLPHRRHQLPWTFAAVVMGFAFGWLFEARNLIIAPVVAHFVINYFNLHHLLRPLTPEEA